jgi:hypothetical protein
MDEKQLRDLVEGLIEQSVENDWVYIKYFIEAQR